MANRRNILIVDDDVDIVRIVSRMLSRDQFNVESAYGGEEALDKVRASRPDVILLDIMMPRMSGIEVLRRIKDIDPTIRIIMITAFGDIDTYLDAMEWGALEYINKPFETEELLRMIDKISANPASPA